MKKILLLAGLCLVYATKVNAQTSERKVSIGVNAGLSDYHGELNQKWFNFDGAYRGQIGLNINGYLSKSFNLGTDITIGNVGRHVPGGGGFRADMGQANVNLRFKFNNDKIMREDHMVQPFIFIGTGVAHYLKDNDGLNVPGTDWTGTAGLGVNVMFTPLFGINYTGRYIMTNHDKRDGISVGYNDQYMIHTLGLVFNLGKVKDSDGDGVSDRKDKCPDTPAGVKVDADGCPVDRDGDGIPDYLDKCPDVAGLKKFDGCPDTDGDGIQDSEDKCPDVPGVASAQGCPDRDGDGVPDSEDKCPDVAGLKKFHGCPDTDGDGIPDHEDECPKVKGLPEFKGCPDTDGDGIPDHLDKCPKVKGVASNNGCPEVKEETKKVFEKALKGIQFETGKDIIKKNSYGILDNIVTIMKMNPDYNLEINGHTDSQGDDAKNMVLSQKRAESVKNYLVSKGVESNRLEAKGHGETKPKATNDTAAGRAENRRVEFVVVFER